MIVVVDYGIGNLRSIQNMLHRAGVASEISGDTAMLRKASKLILPGVGHFGYAMDALRQRGLVEILNERVLEARTPVLGICLGAQLLGRSSEEGSAEGLGWLAMDTIAFDRSRLGASDKIPHMGWAETRHTDQALFAGLKEPARFYLVHSYHFRCDSSSDVIATAHHGYDYPVAVGKGHILGTQFHPEKSHVYGQQLLKNFAVMKFS